MNVNDPIYETYIGVIKNQAPFSEKHSKDYSDEYLHTVENKIIDGINIPFEILTPSELEGISENEEQLVRLFCNTVIQESGIVLKLPQMTILTAMNIFNRFYWKKSFISFEPFHVICASLSLSTKTEETFRRLRDIISSCYFILKRKEEFGHDEQNFDKHVIDVTGEHFNRIKTNIVIIESYVLKELGFSLYTLTDHPHKYLVQFMKNLKGNRELLQRSWNYLNDAYRTSLPVNFNSPTLACASIFLAARNFYFPLPTTLYWWEAYETRIEDIQEVCAVIMKVNEMEKIQLRRVKYILKNNSPFKDEIEQSEKKIDSERKKELETKRRKEKYKYGRSRSRSRSRRRNRNRSRSKNKKHRRSCSSS